MKRLMLSLLFLFSSYNEAGNKWEVQLPGGGMRFQGELIAEACSVDISDKTQVINMGQLRTNMLNAPGQYSPPVIFDIHLRDCSIATSKYVSVAFFGVANDKDPNIISISNESNSAKGIGLALFDTKEVMIPINSFPRKIDSLRNGDMTLHFIAKYRATSYQIIGGRANAQAFFSLTYE